MKSALILIDMQNDYFPGGRMELVGIQDACATRNLEFAGQIISAELVHASFMAALASAYARVLDLNEFINGMAS
jgi:hypothetical protein